MGFKNAKISSEKSIEIIVKSVLGLLFKTAVTFSRPTFPPPTIKTRKFSSFKKTGNKVFLYRLTY